MVKKKLEKRERTPRGSVAVEVYRGHFRLRWRYQGERMSLYTGIPESVAGRKVAESRANQIELDILSGNFDPSLKKYRSGDPDRPKTPPLITSLEQRLAENFNPADDALLKLLGHYGIPITTPQGADQFIGWLRFTRKVKPSSLQRYLNTARKLDRVNFGHITIKQESSGIPTAYSAEQIRGILAFLDSSREYRFYRDLVVFYCLSGCRTSEALALQWKHVHLDRAEVHFTESLALQQDGSLKRKSTKTGKSRVLHLSPSLLQMLTARYQAQGSPAGEALVFPSPKGGIINRSNFSRRVWRRCLEAAGIPYQPRETTPYKMRHTAVSHALKAGVSPQDVAAQVGHTPRTLWDKYASVINRVESPDFLMGGQ